MAINISSYVDPGVYIQEVIVPGSVSTSYTRTLGIVGTAPRTRRTSDEAMIRGKIYAETLTVAAASPHTATLVNTSNRSRNAASSQLYMNGNKLPITSWTFLPAHLVSTEWAGATVDVSAATGKQYFTLALDGKRAVTIDFQVAVTAILGAPATATAANICSAINYDLGNAAGAHYAVYGAAYAAVATSATGVTNKIITLTSPSTDPTSDLKIFLSEITAKDGASVISAAAWAPAVGTGIQAKTRMQVYDPSYVSSATYTLDYISVDVLSDVLANAGTSTPLIDILNVGSYPGGTNYVEDTDYEEGASNDCDWDVTSWSQGSAATLDFVLHPPTIVVSTNDKLLISMNGRNPVTVTLTAGAPTTKTVVAADINAAFASLSSAYGPEFSHVATVVGDTVVITCPNDFENYLPEKGAASSVQFRAVSHNAFTTLFGAITLPYTVTGVGKRPSFGTTYYATYDYTRPSTDYTTGHKIYNSDQLYAYTTQLTMLNYTVNGLCVAGELAFENSASAMYLFQINDSIVPGTPTLTEIENAIDVAKLYSGVTDVVVLDTTEDVAVYTMGHVADQTSLLEKHYRRGWFGMARGTDVGDPDTPDTFVHRAANVLQPSAKSPARGRLFLMAPGDATRTITLDSGVEIDLELDGSYVAIAAAALYTSLPSASSSMMGHTLTGFKTDDSSFGTFLKGERATMADNGVFVVTMENSTFKMLDPLSTEAGGGKVVQFEEPASSAQKDAVTQTVDTLLMANVVGVVPDELTDFLAEVKKWILLGIRANIENGNIAKYRNGSGFPRDIDPVTDIQVFQSTTDPRTFYFKYWFNLKYPAKRFFGEYSVDNPFFNAA